MYQPTGEIRNSTRSNVAVVVPTHKRFSELNSNEILSLKQIRSVLHSRDIYLVHPQYVDPAPFLNIISFGKARSLPMDDKFFGSISKATKFLLSATLYNHLSDYEYLLIHHMDAFVFSDQLDYWCNQGIDYIGAPWMFDTDPGVPIKFNGVGNGGFSLRRIKSFQQIASNRTFVLSRMKVTFFIRFLQHLPLVGSKTFKRVEKILARLHLHAFYEDSFWGIVVPIFHPWFKVGTAEQAVSFSFEANPRTLFKLNNDSLPFGCHAWERNDPDFWQPLIENARYKTA